MADQTHLEKQAAAAHGAPGVAAATEPAGPGANESNVSNAPSSYSGSVTTISPEEERERARQANPNGFANASGGVNIERAASDFAQLQREISAHSRISRVQSRQSHHGADIEKAKSGRSAADESDSTEDVFDLEATLRGDLAAEQAAGIKPKHIGIYWDNLTVKGMGGLTNYVQTFPDAFKNFF